MGNILSTSAQTAVKWSFDRIPLTPWMTTSRLLDFFNAFDLSKIGNCELHFVDFHSNYFP